MPRILRSPAAGGALALSRAALCASVVLIVTFFPAVGRQAEAGEPDLPAPQERVQYWLDRLIRGPEPSSFGIPNFHMSLLRDAERSLVLLGDVTLDRLSDAALRTRLTTQADANPWHSILRVLAQLGPRRPALARLWAEPALESRLLTLRREALVSLAELADPADGPQVAAFFERNPSDRILGPLATRLLLSYGAPWDAIVARTVLERGEADLPDGTGTLWNGLAFELEETLPRGFSMPVPRKGREAAQPTSIDALAWWALLSEAAGPRAATSPSGESRPRGANDPGHMQVIGLAHALTSGARPAAAARALLGRHGAASAVASIEADGLTPDPVLVSLARQGLVTEPTPVQRQATLDASERFVGRAATAEPRSTPAEAVALLDRLLPDRSPEGTLALGALFGAFPTLPAWKDPLLLAFRALLGRGEEPVERVSGLLHGTDATRIDLAFVLMPLSKNRAYIPVVEAFLADPTSTAWRPRARRLLAFLYVEGLRHELPLPMGKVSAFAHELRRFAEDPDDPSAAGLIGTLLDLGPAGEAEIASALGGPKRALYVEALAHANGRPVGLAVIEALLAPITNVTPVPERQAVLVAVYQCAPAEASSLLEALSKRLLGEAAEDVETVRRIIRQR